MRYRARMGRELCMTYNKIGYKIGLAVIPARALCKFSSSQSVS
jgi:hypothetical protein